MEATTRKVKIEVSGGVASVTECPEDVEVEIVDYDNGSEVCSVCGEEFTDDVEMTSIQDHSRCTGCQKLYLNGIIVMDEIDEDEAEDHPVEEV